jgi:hypothetical protein
VTPGRPLVLVAALAAAGAGLAPGPGVDDVVVSEGGFRPKLLRGRKGETLRLKVSTADGEHCFAVDAFRVEKRILPGRPVTVDLALDRAGAFPFHCCLHADADAERGQVTVSE